MVLCTYVFTMGTIVIVIKVGIIIYYHNLMYISVIRVQPTQLNKAIILRRSKTSAYTDDDNLDVSIFCTKLLVGGQVVYVLTYKVVFLIIRTSYLVSKGIRNFPSNIAQKVWVANGEKQRYKVFQK